MVRRGAPHLTVLWILIAGAILVLVGVAVISANDTTTDGPIDLGEPGTSTTASIVTEAGSDVAYGHSTAINRGDKPITLISATMAEPEGEHPLIIQTWVAPLGPNTGRAIATVWPADPPVDEATLSDVEGFVIQPGTSSYFTFVVAVRQEGVWEWPGVEVTYSYDGDTYTERVDNRFRVCAPVAESCP